MKDSFRICAAAAAAFAGLAASCAAVPAASPAGDAVVVVFLESNPDRAEMPEAELEKLFEGHFANLRTMHADGRLFAAGPFVGGGGLAILNTADPDAARAWFQDDPTVVAERFRLTYMPGRLTAGLVCRVEDENAELGPHALRVRPGDADAWSGAVRVNVAHSNDIVEIRPVADAPGEPAPDGPRFVYLAEGTIGAPCAGRSLRAG